MQIALITIHLLACIVMVLVVLLQTGKGASLGAAFGGASQTVFGSTGAQTFLGKMTTAVAIIFMLTSLVLSVGSLGASSGSSLMQDTAQPQAPAATQAATEAAATAAADEAKATEAAAQTQAVDEQKPAATAQAAAPATDKAKAPAEADKK